MKTTYTDKNIETIFNSTNTYYKLSDEHGSFYFIAERVVDEENYAGLIFFIKGAVENGISLKIERVADLKLIRLGYLACEKLQKIKLGDFVLEAVPLITKQWQELMDNNSENDVFQLPLREIVSRSALEYAFNIEEGTKFMSNFIRLKSDK